MRLWMVRHMYRNKGFTMVEMVFVLSVAILMSSLIFLHIPDVSNIKFKTLKELLLQSQFDSMTKMKRNEIEIIGSEISINSKKYDISPLVCDPVFFHYNEQGNISKAFTLRCYSSKLYEARFQLGSGWISYE